MKRERVALLLILLVAGVLRFTALDQGLRHEPHMDERHFVENASRMWSEGSLDHSFYEYPGLLFYLLAPVVGTVSGGEPPGPEAYLAARGFLAAFGVLAVALAAQFARALAGPVAGLVAAAFLAVSPVHVETAHMLRPDVALEVLALLVFLATLRVGPRLRNDALVGAAVGAAFGLKFSGALAALAYVVRRLIAPGPRVRGLLVAGTVAVIVFVAVSPYAVFNYRSFIDGAGTQLAYHYREQGPTMSYGDRVAGYLIVWPKAFGPIGVLLALAGVALARPRWRVWLPFLILPPLTAALFATSGYRFDRHLIPSSSIVASLIDSLSPRSTGSDDSGRSRSGSSPSGSRSQRQSTTFVRSPAPRPVTVRRTGSSKNVPAPARVLTTVPQLRVDSSRYELLRLRRADVSTRLLLREMDATIDRPRDESSDVFARLPPPRGPRTSRPLRGPAPAAPTAPLRRADDTAAPRRGPADSLEQSRDDLRRRR